MAKITTVTNPLTGQPAQVDQLDHTAQQIDDAIARALPGGAIDIALQNNFSTLLGLLTKQTTFVASFQGDETCDNAPMGIRKTMSTTGFPSKFREWALIMTYYYNAEKQFGWQIAYDMAAYQIAYRYKRKSSWYDWKYVSTTDHTHTPASIGVYSRAEIDALLTKKRLYFVSGLLLDANGDTTEGVGTATINVDTNGIARIDFSIKITQTHTTSTFDFGINPALFTSKNANIPTITPVDGGTLVMIDTESKYGGGNGYSGTFQTGSGRWRPSRMYDTAGGIGGWASANMDAGMVLTGTCYGTVNS